jgi:hypothetical protein
MYTRLSILICLCAAAAFANEAIAATLPAPSVEYSADRIIESEAGAMHGKVYSAKDRERTEMQMQGMQTVMIIRRDKQLGWMLLPMQKMYQQMDFAQAQERSGAAPDDQVEITDVGSETIEGLASTKYRMLMKDGGAGGFIWITTEGIPVKMDMLSKSGRDKSRITVTLKNIQIGAQDPRLFELPDGYTAMPSFGFSAGKSKNVGGVLKSAFSNIAGR